MRGKQEGRLNESLGVRITPADAGKTYTGSHKTVKQKDHPRGCGENLEQVIDVKQVTGSPPRMRGKLIFVRTVPLRPGITPADAGKTSSHNCVWSGTGDHPRGCGENLPEVVL